MRANLILTFLIGTLLWSCHNDDDSNSNNDSLLTETNYVYEGNLYNFYLHSQIDSLNQQITIWQAVSSNDPGYNDAQQNIGEAQNTIQNYNVEIAGLVNITDIQGNNNIRIIGPIGPPPPLPCLCYPIPNSLQYLATLNNTSQLRIKIVDANGQTLQNSTNNNTLMDLPDFVGQVKYQTLNNSTQQYVGTISIYVTRIDNQNVSRTYKINGYMFQP